MSNFIIDPYRFVEPCPTCWEENNGGDHGFGDPDQQFGQRLDAGSCVIGKTISSVSWWLKSGSGSTGTLYGVLLASNFQTKIATLGSINANTIGTSFTKFTFDSESTSGTVAQGNFIGIWIEDKDGGTIDVRANTSGNLIPNQSCCTGDISGSFDVQAGNSFTYCYEEA